MYGIIEKYFGSFFFFFLNIILLIFVNFITWAYELCVYNPWESHKTINGNIKLSL